MREGRVAKAHVQSTSRHVCSGCMEAVHGPRPRRCCHTNRHAAAPADGFGLCCGFPVEGYQNGGQSNGTSGGSAISPEARGSATPFCRAGNGTAAASGTDCPDVRGRARQASHQSALSCLHTLQPGFSSPQGARGFRYAWQQLQHCAQGTRSSFTACISLLSCTLLLTSDPHANTAGLELHHL